MILILLDTGIRASECARLTVGDVDLTNSTITIKPFNSSRKSKPRQIPIGKTCRRALWKYLASNSDASAPLFASPNGKALDKDGIRQLLNRLGQRAKVQKQVYPHRFRHTFAINYLRNDGDIYSLQRILGHKSLEMIRRYLAIVQADVQNAHRKASPADNWGL